MGCDRPGCGREARNRCARCGCHICAAHRIWVHERDGSFSSCDGCFVAYLGIDAMLAQQQENRNARD